MWSAYNSHHAKAWHVAGQYTTYHIILFEYLTNLNLYFLLASISLSTHKMWKHFFVTPHCVHYRIRRSSGVHFWNRANQTWKKKRSCNLKPFGGMKVSLLYVLWNIRGFFCMYSNSAINVQMLKPKSLH